MSSMGLVHLYTGDGKGKTTAAFGLALRVIGRGGKALIIQFLKGSPSGEVLATRMIPNLEVKQFGTNKFVDPENLTPEDYARARQGLEAATEALKSGEYRLVVLDEINVAVSFGLLPEETVIDAIKHRDKGTEVVLTGRNAPKSFFELADYVTEFKEIKHPFSRGILAREGIEY